VDGRRDIEEYLQLVVLPDHFLSEERFFSFHNFFWCLYLLHDPRTNHKSARETSPAMSPEPDSSPAVSLPKRLCQALGNLCPSA
jgi:hypothetical protein